MINIQQIMTMMMQSTQTGGNPMQILQRMIPSGDPRMAQMQQLIQGKNPQQLMQTAENMCRQRGMTLQQFGQSLGLPMPGPMGR